MTDERRPYVRVYYDVIDDPKFKRVYPDDALFGRWVKLLMQADAAFPASSPIPRSAKSAALRVMSEDGIINVEGDYYRILGLPAERARRAEAARNGGHVRAEAADRDGRGRFLPSLDQPSESSAGASAGSSSGGPAPVQPVHPAHQLSKAEQSKDEQEQESEQSLDDPDGLVAYHRLTGRFPVGRTREWIEEMAGEFGHGTVESALAGEYQADRNTRTLLERTQSRLRKEDYAAEMARKAKSEQPRRRLTPEEQEAHRRRYEEYRQELASMRVMPGGRTSA